MSITTHLLIIIIFFLLFSSGCGKPKKQVSTIIYPDSLSMFEKVYKENTHELKTSPHKSSRDISLDGKLSRKDLDQLINKADFSKVTQLINEGYPDQAKARLKMMMQKYADNPFVMLQCNFYYADILHNGDSKDWRDYMDKALKSYNDFSSNKKVQKIYDDNQKNMDFFNKYHPLITSEVNDNVYQ